MGVFVIDSAVDLAGVGSCSVGSHRPIVALISVPLAVTKLLPPSAATRKVDSLLVVRKKMFVDYLKFFSQKTFLREGKRFLIAVPDERMPEDASLIPLYEKNWRAKAQDVLPAIVSYGIGVI